MIRVALLVLHTLGAALALLMVGLAMVTIDLLVEAIRGDGPGPGVATVVFAVGYSLAMLHAARRTFREARDGFRICRALREAERARAPTPLPRARLVRR